MKLILSFFSASARRGCAAKFLAAAIVLAAGPSARGEAMLELFNVPWAQLTQKMPEIAEAGYDSLWLPNPGKGNSGAYSYGYDMYDPFDLGDKNQQGTVATRWGTRSQLVQMVQTAHRFGIRVYFDNVMNHRASTVPGYPGSGTPTNYYPGLVPQDFHLKTVSGGYNNWPDIGDPYWCTTSVVQNQPLLGLCDLANEPGTLNWNFGNNIGNTITKPVFVRFPNQPELYMDTNGPLLGVGWGGTGWRPFNGTNGQPVAEDVSTYLCRAVAWTLYTTKCDGFRLDAVKHVPSSFFGNNPGGSALTDEPSFAGYTGAVQAMYDYVHGYGNNVTRNGYVETDGNRNSLFNTEAARNDAMIFGEHISPAPTYGEYLNAGMRLQNQPLYNTMNSAFNGGATVAGMDGRDYSCPSQGTCDNSGNYSAAQGVNFSMDQDYGYNANLALEDAYTFMREGLPMVYSDGFNHNSAGGTPIVSYANYLGEGGDNTMPDTMYLHNQLARGGTWARWSDQNIIAFERYDYREGSSAQNQGVVLCVINTKTGGSADITFDDTVGQNYDGYYGGQPITNNRGVGLAVGFPPGSLLVQLASSSPTGGRAYQKLLVHAATTSLSAAQADSSRTNLDATQRLIYVGSQTIPTGGGAIELNVPTASWLMYGYQWPEASRANVSTNAIILRQGGGEVPHITITRTDGANGDPNYNPLFPFKMRGSVDAYGTVITNKIYSNRSYQIDIPVVTNATFDILVRSDASCMNTLVKLDGGIDLNSQMGLGPTNFNGTAPTNYLDLRDNKPGYATDVFLGYEQTAFQFRNGPEKFAAKNTLSNNIVSLGAETYYYTVGASNNLIVSGSGYGQNINNATCYFDYHDPSATNTASGHTTATQRMPLNPTNGQPADIYVQMGNPGMVNTAYIYYTTDGANPEGAFGIGKGTTQVAAVLYLSAEISDSSKEWWKGTIPAQPAGTQVRYKIGMFKGGSYYPGQDISPISDAESTNAKYYGMNQAVITNFNPTTATVWLHNDLSPSNTMTGLQSGFHILRARTFLPRTNQSSVYNTFLQTFYYDGALPTGMIPYPANASTIGSSSYTVVVRADSTVTGVDFNIQDSNTNNDDTVTGQPNGNGNNAGGAPVFVAATQVNPDTTLSATYPNYPQEFRFVYTNIPGNGTATISVRLKEFATSVYTNRFTLLTTTVTTLAPTQVIQIVSPATNGAVLPYNPAATNLIQAYFSASLASVAANFNLFINGALQPAANYILRPTNSSTMNMKIFYYNWINPPAGTNTLFLTYTNAVTPISDARSLLVAPPLIISGLASNNQLLLWGSAPGLNYQVLATTNLLLPFLPVSGIIPSQGLTTSYYDPDPAAQKFYQILMVQ